MSGSWTGLALAVGASAALNASFVIQHAGAVGGPPVTLRRPLATVRSLLRLRVWVLGGVLGLAGWGLHVGALTLAPLSLVQAFVAGGVVLTIPLSVIGLGHHVRPAEARAALLMVAALVLLSVGQGAGPSRPAVPAAAMAAALAVAAAAAAALAIWTPASHRAAALGLAGGVLYGAADLAIKATTSVAARDGWQAAALTPWLPAALAATAGAFFAFQRGLQIGRPVTVVALMTAGTDVVAVAGGLAVLGDPLGRTPALAAAHAAGFALVVLAGWALAPTQVAARPSAHAAHQDLALD